jgi:hypothetical protein
MDRAKFPVYSLPIEEDVGSEQVVIPRGRPAQPSRRRRVIADPPRCRLRPRPRPRPRPRQPPSSGLPVHKKESAIAPRQAASAKELFFFFSLRMEYRLLAD